ncbi:GNAT family protein [Fulvivirgaceae bacterium BMA12]|uniref:GNAT family protein n=1 Tax=Agaribacillus aureus TaxID=3051825 RepID=A0ABT8L4J2_9BACT|nr:GNAT family protein [Fulvivirgaceae bacterium BMA12]
MAIKTLTSERLKLTSFERVSAETWFRLINDKEVAQTTLSLPHPCTIKEAKLWREQQMDKIRQQQILRWSVSMKDNDCIIGSVKLSLNRRFNSAEIGYWLGREYWGYGYAGEAASMVLNYAFEALKLNRVEAYAMVRNKASSKILLKLGMIKEGLHRQLVRRWEEYIDVESYAILFDDWRKQLPGTGKLTSQV